MIPELKTGLFNLLSGSEFETAIGSSKIRYKMAPKDVQFPYCVISIISSIRSKDSGSEFERAEIQFSLFDGSNSSKDTMISSDNINDLGEKLKTLMQDSENTMIVSGYNVVKVKRTTYRELPLVDSVHGLAISFNCVLQK